MLSLPSSYPVVRALLVLVCLPSLVVNVGPGRGLMIHEHPDGLMHTHVVRTIPKRVAHAAHHHHHGDGHFHHHDDVPVSDLTSDHSGEEKHDSNGAIIRGADAVNLKRQGAAAEPDGGFANLHLTAPGACVLPDLPPLPRLIERAEAAHDVQLASLRAVVLLI